MTADNGVGICEAGRSSAEDAELAQVLSECLEGIEAGRMPDADALAAAHPAVADRLRACLASLQVVERATGELAGAAAREWQPGEAECLGDFRLLRELGRGGMGVVYEAEQRSLGRRVALKVLPFAATVDARHLQRFQNEARAAASLHHTNIVPVFFVGSERGVYFYAMQLIEGQSLAAVIDALRRDAGKQPADPPGLTASYTPGDRQAPPITSDTNVRQAAGLSTQQSARGAEHFRAVARLGVQAAEALEHAHQLGVIHRDVKPANLLLDARGQLWVTDFGLAQVTSDTRLTMTGDLVGTLRYMSPEQALAQRVVVDNRTDIYSLGATLYELLTLEPVFTGSNRQELLRQIAFEEPRLPRRVIRSIPKELETVLLKALEKNPADRYATARELAEDLSRFLDDKPIRARRPTPVQRTRKWVQRNPGLVWATAAALLLGTVVSTWQAVRATAAERKALAAAKAERQANEIAEKRLVQLEKANDILGSIFKDLDPHAEEKEGKQLRVLLGERLDRAVKELQGEALGDPLAAAKLQMILGLSLRNLGYAEKAIPLLTQARATLAGKLGPEHPDTLESMGELATAYQETGKYDQALALNEETLGLAKAHLGLEHLYTLNCMNNLAMVYWHTGKHDQCLCLLEEMVELKKLHLGPEHPDTLISMGNLAEVYRGLGKLDKAMALLKKTLELQQSKHGRDHPNPLNTMGNLARAYGSDGKLDQAVSLNEERATLSKRKLGPDHPRTLDCMNDLAAAYKDIGKLDEAIPLYEEVLKLKKVSRGPDHPATLITMSNLGLAYGDAGRLDEALALSEEALKLKKAKLGSDHPDTLMSLNNVACAYLQAGKLEIADRLLRDLVKRRRKVDGPKSQFTSWALGHLGTNLMKQERYAEAEPLYRECMTIMVENYPNNYLGFYDMTLLAGALLGQKRYVEAEQLLLQGYEGMKRQEARIPVLNRNHLPEAAARLVRLYEATNQPEKARAWREKAKPKPPEAAAAGVKAPAEKPAAPAGKERRP